MILLVNTVIELRHGVDSSCSLVSALKQLALLQPSALFYTAPPWFCRQPGRFFYVVTWRWRRWCLCRKMPLPDVLGKHKGALICNAGRYVRTCGGLTVFAALARREHRCKMPLALREGAPSPPTPDIFRANIRRPAMGGVQGGAYDGVQAPHTPSWRSLTAPASTLGGSPAYAQ